MACHHYGAVGLRYTATICGGITLYKIGERPLRGAAYVPAPTRSRIALASLLRRHLFWRRKAHHLNALVPLYSRMRVTPRLQLRAARAESKDEFCAPLRLWLMQSLVVAGC